MVEVAGGCRHLGEDGGGGTYGVAERRRRKEKCDGATKTTMMCPGESRCGGCGCCCLQCDRLTARAVLPGSSSSLSSPTSAEVSDTSRACFFYNYYISCIFRSLQLQSPSPVSSSPASVLAVSWGQRSHSFLISSQ